MGSDLGLSTEVQLLHSTLNQLRPMAAAPEGMQLVRLTVPARAELIACAEELRGGHAGDRQLLGLVDAALRVLAQPDTLQVPQQLMGGCLRPLPWRAAQCHQSHAPCSVQTRWQR